MAQFRTFDARLCHPFTMVISGPSYSGKSTFIYLLLKNAKRMINTEFDYIVCFLGSDDPKLKELALLYGPRITFVDGLPEDFGKYVDRSKNGFILIDDLMQEATKTARVTELYTKTSHHANVSVCLVLQNLFHNGRERHSILRNSHYLVIFRNPLDQSIVYTLAHRINPMNKGAVVKIFLHAQAKYRYLLLDGTQDSLPEARFRTDIFNDFQRCFVIN